METPVITTRQLCKDYGSLRAVSNLDLEIRKGEIFGLLGPNGAGKSTTILMILGLTEPTSGQVSACGYDPATSPIEVKKRVGYLPDHVGFYDNMTGLENLCHIARLNRMKGDIRNTALRFLQKVGLEAAAHRKAGTYSRGMKQRLGLADVLVREPEVIILDEPTLGIDPAGVRDFLQLIRELSREQGLTVLLSSHHLHQVQQVCDRVGIFVRGSLIARGDIPSLSETLHQGQPFTVEAEISGSTAPGNPPVKEQLLALEGVSDVTYDNGKIQVYCSDDITPVIARTLVTSGLDVSYLCKKEYGLDDIYQRYFEGNYETNRNMA
ncbi:ABC transporter ATP-binding protein [Sinomicrobium soli]|uniref:ABC transporter ATP-binding protein n=1 Tax=Sinomicrobium sp. N-1-3-6 TaxID=2219864 RepID=UPI000DCE644C|nr:ABC transporter ATP-binding protein [Sinomicrobium sp. N-1-3-6]RAV28015.1 ABC transporter ATP-binding protein [Sinomicrobium sp. N-1-3-6]